MFALKDDWNKGLVPEDFAKNLLNDYREYFKEDGQSVKNGRQDCYGAFLYFADRILPSINADVTKYQGGRRCEVTMSEVFSVSDEAFALLVMVENYYDVWVSKAEQKKTRNEVGGPPQESRIKGAKYTCSKKGNIHAGWNDEGIARFNDIAKMIGDLRNDKGRNDNIDNALMNHWKGMQRDAEESSSNKKPKKATARMPYMDKIQF